MQDTRNAIIQQLTAEVSLFSHDALVYDIATRIIDYSGTRHHPEYTDIGPVTDQLVAMVEQALGARHEYQLHGDKHRKALIELEGNPVDASEEIRNHDVAQDIRSYVELYLRWRAQTLESFHLKPNPKKPTEQFQPLFSFHWDGTEPNGRTYRIACPTQGLELAIENQLLKSGWAFQESSEEYEQVSLYSKQVGEQVLLTCRKRPAVSLYEFHAWGMTEELGHVIQDILALPQMKDLDFRERVLSCMFNLGMHSLTKVPLNQPYEIIEAHFAQDAVHMISAHPHTYSLIVIGDEVGDNCKPVLNAYKNHEVKVPLLVVHRKTPLTLDHLQTVTELGGHVIYGIDKNLPLLRDVVETYISSTLQPISK